MKPWDKPATVLAFAAWVSVFALTWAMLTGFVAFGWQKYLAWGFFMVVAIAASALASPDKDGDNEAKR